MGKNKLNSGSTAKVKNNPIYKKVNNKPSVKGKKKAKPVKTNLKNVSLFHYVNSVFFFFFG